MLFANLDPRNNELTTLQDNLTEPVTNVPSKLCSRTGMQLSQNCCTSFKFLSFTHVVAWY